jgi:endonuclease IV
MNRSSRFKENCAAAGYTPAQILPHDSYLINLGHPEPEGLEKSRMAFIDEMTALRAAGIEISELSSGQPPEKNFRSGLPGIGLPNPSTWPWNGQRA